MKVLKKTAVRMDNGVWSYMYYKLTLWDSAQVS